MRLEKILLFSDALRKLLQRGRLAFTICIRVFAILLKWRKTLRIKSLEINDSYLLANGLIVIKWQLNNFLWVRINHKIVTTNRKGILLHFDRIENPINLKIIGLFGKYQKNFPILPIATINSKELAAPQLLNGKFTFRTTDKSLSSFVPQNVGLSIVDNGLTSTLQTKVPSLNIQIPTFKQESYHE